MRALRHYAHRSDSEADDTEDETGLSRNASKASSLDELDSLAQSQSSSSIAANIGATFARMASAPAAPNATSPKQSGDAPLFSLERQQEVLFSVSEEDALSSGGESGGVGVGTAHPNPPSHPLPVHDVTERGQCSSIESLDVDDVIVEEEMAASEPTVTQEGVGRNGAGKGVVQESRPTAEDPPADDSCISSAKTKEQTTSHVKSRQRCCCVLV